MKLNANFQSKQPAVEEAPCEVCKVICLTDKEYAFFKKQPDRKQRRQIDEKKQAMGIRD